METSDQAFDTKLFITMNWQIPIIIAKIIIPLGLQI